MNLHKKDVCHQPTFVTHRKFQRNPGYHEIYREWWGVSDDPLQYKHVPNFN